MGIRSGSGATPNPNEIQTYTFGGCVSGEAVERFWGKVLTGASERRQERQRVEAEQTERFKDFKFE